MSQTPYTPHNPTAGQPIVNEQGTLALPAQISHVTQQNTGAATVIVVPPVVIMSPNPPTAPPAHPTSPADDLSSGGGHCERHRCGGHEKKHRCCRRRRWFRFFFFVFLFGGGLLLLARFFNPMAIAFRGVHLDPSQRAELRAIYFDARKDFYKDQDAIRKLQDHGLELLRKDNPNKKEVDALIDAWAERFKQIARSRTDAVLKAHGTLTTAQRHQLAANLQWMRARYERWRGRWQTRQRWHAKTCR